MAQLISTRVVIKQFAACIAASILVSFTFSPAFGQDDSERLEEITVTGSRIRTTGMESPNPVTVVTPEELQVLSPTTLIEGLSKLPQFYQSNTTENTGNFFQTSGAGTLNLRGLQGKRTLTLLSGRRVVPSTLYGGPDINLFPEDMLRTVESVTGGATAAYGTDAVAGAVNLILDTDYTGFKGKIQGGANDLGDATSWEVSLSGGMDVGEKAHVLVSLETSRQEPIWGREDYDWYEGWGLLENPDTTNRGTTPDNPYYLAFPDIVSRKSSLDGIVHFPVSSGLGSYIFDANGNATPFVLGSNYDSSAHSIASSGTGTDNGEPASQLMPKSGRKNIFAYVDYDLLDNLTVFGQVMYGEASFTNTNAGGYFNGLNLANNAPTARSFTVYRGNPFLPANIQSLMTVNNIASVAFGRVGHPDDIAFDAYSTQETETLSVTGGFSYTVNTDGLFDDWVVDGYMQFGKTDVLARQRGGIRLDRIYLAVDAVTNPANGQIVCNVTLVSGLYPDCVPLDLFGRGQASPEAVDWVTGFTPGQEVCVDGWLSPSETMPYCYTSTADKVRDIELEEDVFELAFNGDIHEGWGAGPVSLAFGASYREERLNQYVQAPEGNPTTDPNVFPVRANNAALGIRGVPGGAFASGNSVEIMFSKVPFARGDFSVTEVFSELRAPLLSDVFLVKQLDLSLASRWAEYTGSGEVWSWKAGLEWTATDEVRLRGTVSRDVRAANFAERFDRTGGLGNVIDYGENQAGGAAVTYQVTTITGGNPNVTPEEATTFTGGMVYQPQWLEGLSFAIDWYQIEVDNNINANTVQAVVSGCHLDGDVDLCALITRTGPVSTINPSLNRISLVEALYINVNSQLARGVDFEISYRTPVDWFGGGEYVGVRALGSWLDENSSTNSAGLVTEITDVYGLPEWNFMLSGNYSRGPLNLSLLGRYTGETYQNLNRNYLGASTRWDVADNDVDAEMIVDASISYRFEVDKYLSSIMVYANVNNLFDTGPQAFYGTFDAFGEAIGSGHVGDLRGRRFAAGIRFEY